MKKRPLWKRLLRWLGLGLLVCVGGSIAAVILFRFVPVPGSALMAERRILALGREKPYHPRHQWVPLEDIAPAMGVAVIAAEDQNFPDHFGFDWKAIEKAVAHNEHSRRKRGASTVSQQTAKNLFLWESRSWVRKGFEVYFTLLLEAGWSKRRILEVYLNIVEFGDGIYGVEAASSRYFGKHAKALTPSEAALLAAVLPSPLKYRADAPSAYVRGRQEWILNQMRMLGGTQVVKALG
ncbi:monofunctional biosynthetic peptidoglycan transglycosylase [Mesoterricola silvestris]|uniref:Biosynthetic peptidoglycan transglycosylase n=1 Tax=Mesoterricola silvestris TaxID=2927979 RepID=A0AA48GI37_9BACT|nr:monofunctional biosynthetic peptidoglycan transglycosylase [Mesoterricola silvestris]BDU71409.1 monofunctional biosynthetic peptidoglycan transglycosylase [Mesoterricola silvestris]